MLKAGDRAPNFQLPSVGGKVIGLGHFLGRSNVVLFFYPKDQSAGCTREACGFRDAYSSFKQLDAEILGISPDNVESHQEFSEKQRLPFPLLSDPEGIVRKAYGVRSILGILSRCTFVIDKTGIIRHVYSSQVHPERHVSEAITALSSIQLDST